MNRILTNTCFHWVKFIYWELYPHLKREDNVVHLSTDPPLRNETGTQYYFVIKAHSLIINQEKIIKHTPSITIPYLCILGSSWFSIVKLQTCILFPFTHRCSNLWFAASLKRQSKKWSKLKSYQAPKVSAPFQGCLLFGNSELLKQIKCFKIESVENFFYFWVEWVCDDIRLVHNFADF